MNIHSDLLSNHNERKKSLMKLINDLEYYYQTTQHIKLDNNTKQYIINYYLKDWYLYTDEDLFFNSKNIIDDLIKK